MNTKTINSRLKKLLFITLFLISSMLTSSILNNINKNIGAQDDEISNEFVDNEGEIINTFNVHAASINMTPAWGPISVSDYPVDDHWIGDINNDSLNDIVIPSHLDNVADVFYQKSDNTWSSAPDHTLDIAFNGYSSDFGDLNNDSLPDVVTRAQDYIRFYFQKDDGSGVPSNYNLSLNYNGEGWVRILDLNNDSLNDIVADSWAFWSDNIKVYTQGPVGSFTDSLTISSANDPRAIEVADFNNDTLDDFAVLCYTTRDIRIFFQRQIGLVNSTPDIIIGVPDLDIGDIDVADINKDNWPDIIVCNNSQESVVVYLNEGGTFSSTPSQILTSSNGIRHFDIGDLNNDGNLDIATTQYETLPEMEIWYGNGSLFSTSPDQILTRPANSLNDLCIGDLNGDNLDDILVEEFYPSPPYRQMLWYFQIAAPLKDFTLISPVNWTIDQTPKVIISFETTIGINVSEVDYAYSTTGSSTPTNWAALDGVYKDSDCTISASNGDTGILYAKIDSVLFNQVSDNLNTIRLRATDIDNNTGTQTEAFIIKVLEIQNKYWNFGEPVNFTENSVNDILPHLFIDSNDVMYLTYIYDYINSPVHGDIYLINNSGGSWGAIKNITEGLPEHGYSSPMIFKNSSGVKYISYIDQNDLEIRLLNDSTGDWGIHEVFFTPASLNCRMRFAEDPTTGTIHAVYGKEVGSLQFEIMTQSFNGTEWSTPTQLTSFASGYCSGACRSDIVFNGSVGYIFFRRFESVDVNHELYAIKYSAGSWGSPVQVTNSPYSGNQQGIDNPAFTTDINDNIIGIYYNSTDTETKFYFAKFENFQLIDPVEIYSTPNPFLIDHSWSSIVQDSSGKITIAFNEYDGNDDEIYFIEGYYEPYPIGPSIGMPSFSSSVLSNETITVTCEITDINGIKNATLYYGYSSPYNQYIVAGTNTGGNTWEFVIPAQGDSNESSVLKFYIKAFDKDDPPISTINDNSSSYYGVTVTDVTPPQNPTISINSGAIYTNSSIVNLTLSADDAWQMKFRNENGTWSAWEPYVTGKFWNLSAGYGVKVVYVVFRDDTFNEADPIYASIIWIATNMSYFNTTGTNQIDLIASLGVNLEIQANELGFIEVERQEVIFPMVDELDKKYIALYYYSFEVYNLNYTEEPGIIDNATVQLYFNANNVGKVKNLRVLKYIGAGIWVNIDITIASEDNYVEFETSSFSVYTLVEEDVKEAKKDEKEDKKDDIIIIIIIIIIIGSAIGISATSYVTIKKKAQKKESVVAKKKSLEKREKLSETKVKARAVPPISAEITPKKVTTPIKPKKDKKGMEVVPAAKPGLTLREKVELKRTESELEVKKEKFTCIVHRGAIVGNMYVCPKCQSIYCEKCAKVLKVKGEKCWSCNAEISVVISESERKTLLEKNSVDIVKEIISEVPILKEIIDTDKDYDEIPEIYDYEFTLLSPKELEQIDSLELSLEEKAEFIKELLSLKIDEREGIIDNILKKKSKKVRIPLPSKPIEEVKKAEIKVEAPMVKITCIGHKGPIIGNRYRCPQCDAIYCEKCAKSLIFKGEKCKSCNNEIKSLIPDSK